MQIQNKTILAVLILRELEQAPEPLSIGAIAKAIGESYSYTGAIGAKLIQHGYVLSDRKGYTKARPAKTIPLKEFLAAMEGLMPDVANDTPLTRAVREKARTCVTGTVADLFPARRGRR
jgi:DNA-binding IscR family transcriptional regulator